MHPIFLLIWKVTGGTLVSNNEGSFVFSVFTETSCFSIYHLWFKSSKKKTLNSRLGLDKLRKIADGLSWIKPDVIMVWIKPVSQSINQSSNPSNPDLSSSSIWINTVPAIARASWCSLWQENSTVGLRSLQGNCSQGGVRSFCLSTPSTSTSSITWKSWGYLSGESQASSSGLRGKIRNIWWEHLHFMLVLPSHKRLTYWLNFNMVVPGAMKPVWNWIWKICVLVT